MIPLVKEAYMPAEADFLIQQADNSERIQINSTTETNPKDKQISKHPKAHLHFFSKYH